MINSLEYFCVHLFLIPLKLHRNEINYGLMFNELGMFMSFGDPINKNIGWSNEKDT